MNRRSSSDLKRAIVAGGAGFLGSHLCRLLLDGGSEVLCIDSFTTGTRDNIATLFENPRFSFRLADVSEPVEAEGPVDEVYNLACAASPPRYQADPIHTMMTSVAGTHNLLRLAEAKGARFLQASTSEVYGDPEVHPQAETYLGRVNCTGPRACYDEGKRAAEALCFDFLRLKRVDVRVARIFNTYGPHMHPADGRIVSNLITRALKGEPLPIYGSGEQTRSFCFVDDLVDGLVRLARVAKNPQAAVNLGNPGEFTINELAALVKEMTGSKSPLAHLPLPQDDPRMRRPDIARAEELLGWSPAVSLGDGLAETIAWFRSRTRPEETLPAAAE